MSHETIFRRACLVQLSTSCWTASRQIEPQLMEVVGSPDWVRGRKQLLNPEVLSPIKSVIQKARQTLARHALPFPMPGLFLVPKERIGEVDSQMEHIREEFQQKVAAFLDFYAEALEEARLQLGSLFSDMDYPMDMDQRFKFAWRFVVLETPNHVGILTPELYEKESRKFQELMEETRTLAITALREEFQQIIQHLTERLSGEEDGKAKVFRPAMLSRIRGFLDSFGDRNLFDDAELAALVEQAKTIVAGIHFGQHHYSIQHNDRLRDRIASDMAVLQSTLDAAMEDLPKRKIVLDAHSIPAAA